VLVDKLNKSQLAAKRANSFLGCISKNIANQSREISLFYSALVRHIQFWEQIHKKAMEHLSYNSGLRELGLLWLKKKRLKGDLINVCKYLVGGKRKVKPDSSQQYPVTR